MAAQELRWLTYLLTDLGERPRSPPVLYVDNKAAIALCQEHRTKHSALRYFLARDLLAARPPRLGPLATLVARSPPLRPTRRPCGPLAAPMAHSPLACGSLAVPAARSSLARGPLAAPTARSPPACDPLAAPVARLPPACDPLAALFQLARRHLQPAHCHLRPARFPLCSPRAALFSPLATPFAASMPALLLAPPGSCPPCCLRRPATARPAVHRPALHYLLP
ncbi:unnamed protein product [Closterium sp. NIES-54]